MDDLTTYLPMLLALAGGLLQWLRQFSNFKDWMYYIIAGVLAAGCYVLVTTDLWSAAEWRLDTIHFISSMSTYILSIMGGTFAASNAAKRVVSRNPDAIASVMVPLTDSK